MATSMHHQFMRIALETAKTSTVKPNDNPAVGCVITIDNKIVTKACTQPAGQGHAEAIAIKEAHSQGLDLSGAILYVTLEPCNFVGKTPSCCAAIIKANIATVYAGIEDPHPRVSGRGLAQLRSAGIDVHSGLLKDEISEQLAHWLQRHTP